ncbi:protein phosphatase 1 regulatory subunit 15A [Rousettus aegyptiacus]|uniref:Protein phosphatase 1 regulatory subunit 15A n=1 Tax=Rousettus aegyptiacus TaxID=9407 RepID=A0A7J8CKJ7_ROUAE|nr:protein phosphatase 1 regulatory subunit 15A [Rousettus aegyptiacus]XP_015977976.2 protein phosphatase 1 regulatory subunit 15A [Rousettus aegyptiacus]KAF6411380.1 protein phosphatase 1 regulatory subunit 15A [Rousettus aegyptiacus]
MAPGQVPHQPIPWRDAHPFLLLSPLVGLLSRAWSRLKGPGPPEPWLVEGETSADQGEAGLEQETEAALATHYAPWGEHPQGKAGDSAAREENEASWGPCPDPKVYGSLEAWGLSDDDDDDEEYGGEETIGVPRDQGNEYMGSQPAPLSPSLLRTLKDSSGEEESEEGVVAEDKVVTFFSLSPSHWECCPGVVEEEDAEAINKEALRKSTFPLSPGSKARSCVYCAGEKERTENKAKKTLISSSSAASHPSTWEHCSGEEVQEDTKSEKGEADPGPHPVLAQRPLLRAWEHQPSKITEDGEDEDSVPGEAEGPSSIPPRSAFFRAWVYRPGEDMEEEEEDSDLGETEEEGEAEGPSSIQSTSAFSRTWVYQPGEDTEEEEDSDLGETEEEGEAEGPSSIQSTSAFSRTWVYQPGEDTEEEEDSDLGETEEEGEAEGPSSIQPKSAFFRAWVYQPGEDTEEEEDSDSGEAEEGEAEGPFSIQPTSTFLRTWVYRPGEDTEEEEEDSDSGEAEEVGEAEGLSSIQPTSAFLRTWVYRPGEDTEDEEEENEEEKDESEVTDLRPSSSLQAQSTLLGGWSFPSGEETGGREAAEELEAEPHRFRVAIYLPGEKPPAPWAPSRLPFRLQKRLKPAETPTQHLDPETPQEARKVRFSEKVSIHLLAVWAGPARAARRGPWEQLARDRSRFARRIAQAQEELGPCLTPAARARAWARLGNPAPSLAAIPAPAQTLPTSSVQATPLSHAVASPSPLYASPCLDLSGRRG